MRNIFVTLLLLTMCSGWACRKKQAAQTTPTAAPPPVAAKPAPTAVNPPGNANTNGNSNAPAEANANVSRVKINHNDNANRWSSSKQSNRPLSDLPGQEDSSSSSRPAQRK